MRVLWIMGAQWKHAGRIENSSKRGALISKLVKEIMIAAKAGDAHPSHNARLRVAIEAAKKNSVPRDNIERAIQKGSGFFQDAVPFELVTYEGFAPCQVPVIVECLTDNKNRTAADIRVLFRKGTLGAIGSVSWMFQRLGVIEATHAERHQDMETIAIEAGAQEVENLEASEIPQGHQGARFFCTSTDLDLVSQYLTQASWVITLSEMQYVAKNPLELPDAGKTEVIEFLDNIDSHDDIHRVFAAMK